MNMQKNRMDISKISNHHGKILQEERRNESLRNAVKKGIDKPTASTGTPMEDLHGAAQFTATLANIGEGSKATGGGGMEQGIKTVVGLAESNGKLRGMKGNQIVKPQDDLIQGETGTQELLT